MARIVLALVGCAALQTYRRPQTLRSSTRRFAAPEEPQQDINATIVAALATAGAAGGAVLLADPLLDGAAVGGASAVNGAGDARAKEALASRKRGMPTAPSSRVRSSTVMLEAVSGIAARKASASHGR